MKFTLKWLKQFLDTNASLKEITDNLNLIGLEVDSVADPGQDLREFEVGKIKHAETHPNADNLKLCKVESSSGELEIVCGAPNAREGIKVVLAKVGTIIPTNGMKIKQSKIRGVTSNGMLCSEKELGVGTDGQDIIELPEQAKIGEEFSPYYGLDDPVIEIDLTPNRGDCLGVYGIARDLAATGIGSLKEPDYAPVNSQNSSNIKLEISNEQDSSLFIAREFKNVKNTESPQWLKNLLKNIGHEPISALVDITNYIVFSYGRPLHVYDADKISGNKLIIDRATKGEKFTGLDDNNYELAGGEIVVRDETQLQALGGIIGAKDSGCSFASKNIILEAALFDPISVAKTGRYHMIDTDSRYRFERGVDANFTNTGAEIASRMIQDICGGEPCEYVISGQTSWPEREIEFDINTLGQKAGQQIGKEKISTILNGLGFGVSEKSENTLQLQIPSWRNDISIKEDIVEEITRIYGYNNLVLKTLPQPTSREVHRLISTKQDKIQTSSRLMALLGYNEVVSWSFMDRQLAENFTEISEDLKLVNPIAGNLDYMRPSIIPNLLNMAKLNLSRSLTDFALFEIGPTFKGLKPEEEITKLEAIRLGKISRKNIHEAARDVDIYDIKADLERLCYEIKIPFNSLRYSFDAASYYHPTKSARLLLGKNEIATFGEIHPKILKQFDITETVVALEVNYESLPNKPSKTTSKGEYKASKYQKVSRDFAFLVPEDKPVAELTNIISKIDKQLIRNIEVFDIYKGDKIDSGYKSVALNVEIQADDHTLQESELTDLSNRIIEDAKKIGSILRDK